MSSRSSRPVLAWIVGAFVLLPAAPPARGVTQADLERNNGTLFVMIGSQTETGAAASISTEGVYRIRRRVVGDDGTYYTIKLSDPDPNSTDAADRAGTPAFPVVTGKSLGVDKFLRVYLQDVSIDSTWHDVAGEAGGASNMAWTDASMPTASGTGVSVTHNMAPLAQIAPDGTISYPGAALWTRSTGVSKTGRRAPAHSFSGGGATSHTGEEWTFNAMAGATYVPAPAAGVFYPLTLMVHHDIFTSPLGPPIPAGGSTSNADSGAVAMPIPVNVSFVSDVPVTHDDCGRAGNEYRQWTSARFRRNIFRLFQYADNLTVSQISGLQAGKCQAGDPVFSSVSYEQAYTMRNNCDDGCVTASSSGTVSGETADAKAMFSSFGQNLSDQRMYVALQSGGTASLLQFTLAATNPCDSAARWARTAVPTSGNSLVKKIASDIGPTTETNFKTVGISSRDSTGDYLYLSNLAGNKFAVSSNVFLQGGIVWQLRSGAGVVDWEERIESDTVTDNPATSLPGSVNVGSGVIAITADGEGNLFYTRNELDPPNAGLPNDLYGQQSGAAIFTSANPYFVSMVSVTGELYTHRVTFRQFAGFGAYKTNRSNASARRIGLIPVGENRYEGHWNATTQTWANPPTTGMLITPAVTVDNRVELAAVNVSFPPPVDSVNTVDILHRGTSLTGTPIAPSPDASISIAEDALDQFFDVENPPEFGGLFRVDRSRPGPPPIGYSNMGPTDNRDADGSIGRFSSSVIWGSDISDTGKDFQYRWEVSNITFEGMPDPDANRGIRGIDSPAPQLLYEGGGPGPALTASATGYSMGYVTPPRNPTNPSGLTNAKVQIPRLKVKFSNPGRYRIRLYVRGYYWNMQLGPLGLSGPVTFVAQQFGDHGGTTTPMLGQQIVNVAAAVPPPGTDFVYNVQTIGAGVGTPPDPEAGAPSQTTVVIDQGDTGNAAKIYADGLVSWYQADHYDDSTGQMAKTSGCGVWQYDWDPSADTYDWPLGSTNAPNYPTSAPPGFTRPLPHRFGIRNDGDGAGGTMRFYTGTLDDMDHNDPASQVAHDWYEIKYEWKMRYLDPTLAKFLTPGAVVDPATDIVERTLKQGNLSELVVLKQLGLEATLLPASLGAERQFIKKATVANPPGMSFARVFRFRLPLLDPARTATMTHPSIANPNNSFYGRPGGGAGVAPTWTVPTEPVPIDITCRFFYPRVKWVELKAPAPSPPPPVVDAQDRKLYWVLADDTAAGFSLAAPGDPGRYRKGATTGPRFTYDAPGASDSDDYAELLVRDTGDPYRASSSVAITGIAGATSAADLDVSIRDNNPYLHFQTHDTVRTDLKVPKLQDLFVELGREADTGGRDFYGVGLRPAGGHWGFDVNRWQPSAILDFPSEPANPYRMAPPSGFAVSTMSAPSSPPPTWTRPEYTYRGRVWQTSETDAMWQAGSSTNAPATWWDPVLGRPSSYREVSYRLAAAEVPLPLFHRTQTDPFVAAATGYGPLKMLARMTDGVRTIPFQAGEVSVSDTGSPPHLRVMLLNEKTHEAIYYVVENNWQWVSTTQAIPASGAPWKSIVKKLADPRAPFSAQAGFYIEMDPPASAAVGVTGIPSARVYDFATISTGQGRFLVEEDVRLLIKAWTVDNIAFEPRLVISRDGGPFDELGSQTPTYEPASLSPGQPGTKTGWNFARHSYTQQGVTDTIVVTAGDGTTGVQVRIPVAVVRFTPGFKSMGESTNLR